jgi:hypothetical protein
VIEIPLADDDANAALSHPTPTCPAYDRADRPSVPGHLDRNYRPSVPVRA